MLAHHRPRSKELPAADAVERGAGVSEHVELVEDDLRLLKHRPDGSELRAVPVGPHGRNRRAPPTQVRSAQAAGLPQISVLKSVNSLNLSR